MKFLRPFLVVALTTLMASAVAQVAINTDASLPDASAMLDIKSTSSGLLIPRMTTAQRTSIGSPAQGLMVYDTDLGAFVYYQSGQWMLALNGA